MRIATLVAGATVLAVAAISCSSGTPDPSCNIPGLYTAIITSVISGDCPVSMMPVVDTFMVSGNTANLVVQGLAGPGCPGQITNSCTWTASCTFVVTDATNPSQNLATRQYSWTFTNSGFSGTSAVTFPPATSLPNGCTGIVEVTGTRQ